MKAAGNRPTARAVRERIGSGSMGTIHRLLQQWSGKGSEADEETESTELPGHIQKALMDFIETEIATACEPLNDELQQAKSEINAMAEENERLEIIIDRLQRERDDAERKQNICSALLSKAENDLIETRCENNDLKKSVSDLCREIDKKERQLEIYSALPFELSTLKQAHEELTSQYATANTERAVLSAQLNAAATRGNDLVERLASAEKRNTAQDAELKAATNTAQRATAELSAIARELAELKNNTPGAKIVKSTAKKTTVKKPTNQELAV